MDRNVFLTLTVRNVPVALRKESVDRNHAREANHATRRVALRKESVDRNIGPLIFNVQPRVALRKESVDRNRNAT